MRTLRRLALDWAYLVLGFPIGVAAFTWVVTGWSVSLSTLIVWIGVPLAAATIGGTRGIAAAARYAAALLDGAPWPSRYRRLTGSAWSRLKALLGDGQTWRDLGWAILGLPIGTVQLVIACLPVWALGGITLPIWWRWTGNDYEYVGFAVNTAGRSWICFAIGIVALPVGLLLVRGVAAGTGAMARWLLAPSREKELEARVETLTETRAGAVSTAAADLERIERDLHDGAQARLVALALDLGIAEEKLAAGDADAARELVARARDEAKRANSELRDLARGIRPPLLADRGLDEAVRALVLRTRIPVAVSVDVPERPDAAIETAAYFVVAEALTNVAKHSDATSASVRVTRLGPRLEVEVRDDGTGGADAEGDGLLGLRRRIEALDGRLDLASPEGGPTVLRAELPCG
ncbi:MAG TPA: sensor domain-containing protein [Solirubrobacteraceae bacterium]|jgi:signal transduction histidine kinase|nr:sensor domain-containing protein [Solirubrobacteraceae bacterium]